MVRKHDRDRYALGMMASKKKRVDLWPLYAFNYEIAKTREVVTETQLGLIRLQWWRDALNNFYETGVIVKHDVFEALIPVITKHQLSQDDFEALLYAREFDLEDRQPANLEGLVSYADYTTTPLTRLALQILEQDAAGDDLKAVSIAYALCGLLRAITTHDRQGRCYLPADMVTKADIKPDSEKLRETIKAVIEEAERHLATVSTKKDHIGTCYALTKAYLNRMEKMEYNVFDRRLEIMPLSFLVRSIFW